ncbi:MAG: hypothetical protein AAF490_07980 [Chloroflexota bacterium]
MDLDDIVKALLPKSTRKKLKKSLKKMDLGDILKLLFASLLGRGKNGRSDKYDKYDKYDKSRKYDKRDKKYGRSDEYERELQPAPRQTFSLGRQTDPTQEAIQQARNYDKQIAARVRKAPRNSLERTRLTSISQNVKEWVLAIEQIAQRMKQQEQDPLIAKEQEQVPKAIKRLERQLNETTDEKLVRKLNITLENRRKQLAHLEQAQTNRQLSALKIENTLAQLGIIYSQIVSEPFIAQQGIYDRLAAEIQDEVLALEDYLASLDELQQGDRTWTSSGL